MTNKIKNVPKLRFPEFKGEWGSIELGNIAENYTGGGTPSTKVKEYWEGNIPWIQSSDLKIDDVKNVEFHKYINSVAIENSSAKLIPENSIAIVTRVGVGKLALIRDEFSTSQDFLSLSNLLIDTNYALYALYKLIRKESTKLQGTSIKGLTKNDLLRKQIKKPLDINEQEQIGYFFSKLDRQIELEEQKLVKLEEQKKGYMQQIFSKELRFKDDDGNDYPKWEEINLGSLYKMGKAGGTPKSTESKYYNGEIPFLSISDITKQGKFLHSTEKKITQEGLDNSTAWLVPVNSINYAMYASVGYLSINKIGVATSQAIFNMVFEDYNLVEYLYYYLNHIRDKGVLEKLMGTGTQSNLSASIMKNISVKRPSKSEMIKINTILSNIDELICSQIKKIELLKKRKQGFLQKMFV